MKTQVERSIAYWCDGDTQNFHRASLLASGLNPTDGPTLEAIASAYTRQQLQQIAESEAHAVEMLQPWPAVEEVRGLCTGRIVTLPSDVLTRQQLDEIAYPCEHATADVLADDGWRMTLRCTWGCGRLIETAVQS